MLASEKVIGIDIPTDFSSALLRFLASFYWFYRWLRVGGACVVSYPNPSQEQANINISLGHYHLLNRPYCCYIRNALNQLQMKLTFAAVGAVCFF